MEDDLKWRYGEERLPRYTSYPASPMFSDAVSHDSYAAWLGTIPAEATASIYLHLPFCRSMCWYCGCNTMIARRDAPIADYVGLLKREIGLVMDRIAGPMRLGHVHFGGGTPTIMAPHEIENLLGLLTTRSSLAADAEIAIEVDPRTLTRAMTAALGAAGFTRASLGVQSFDPLVQKAINRIQSFEETAKATEDLRDAGIRSVNFDLIYGLPHQTVASCIESVRQCLQLRPDRLAVFGYAHVPAFKKHQRMIDEAQLPDGTNRREQAEAIAEVLTNVGYRRIGLDHYALPEDALVRAHANGTLRRNFQGYTTDLSAVLLGFGASAIGCLPQGYVQNATAVSTYAERISKDQLVTAKGYALTPEDRLRAAVIERIMCDFYVDIEMICREHGASPRDLLASAPRLGTLACDGVITFDGMILRICDDARSLVRNVAAAFDAYLGASERPHSRAI